MLTLVELEPRVGGEETDWGVTADRLRCGPVKPATTLGNTLVISRTLLQVQTKHDPLLNVYNKSYQTCTSEYHT